MKVFEKEGAENSEEAVRLAAEKAIELDIKEVVVASNTGKTAILAMKAFKGAKVVIVTQHAGSKDKWKSEMPEKVRSAFEEKGAVVVTASHVLSGIERSFNDGFKGIYPSQIVAEALRLFGQGVKVCVEISVMAADAGALSGNPVVVIAGSGSGADTAVVLTPAHANRFLELRVHEIICKPA
jgi:hypothetical protein